MEPKVLDELYDAMGGPPIFINHFNERVRFPLRDLPVYLERETGEKIEPEHVSELAKRGWFPVLSGNIEDDELGVPFFVPARLGLLLRLEREGWTHAELRAFAEFEDAMIEEIYTTDELSYHRTDYEVLVEHLRNRIAMLENTLRTIDEPGWTPDSGAWTETSERAGVVEELNQARPTLAYLGRFERVAELPTKLKKLAYQLRFGNELTRAWMCQNDRAKIEAGYSFFVHFEGAQNPTAGDFGEGIDWETTLRRPWASEEELPIRLPGIILRGDSPQLTGSPRPKKYDELWKAYRLEDYFRIRAKIRDTKVCLHCLMPLEEDSMPTRMYCGDRCRNAAKGRRRRERDPEAVLESQIRYYSSLAELQERSAARKSQKSN